MCLWYVLLLSACIGEAPPGVSPRSATEPYVLNSYVDKNKGIFSDRFLFRFVFKNLDSSEVNLQDFSLQSDNVTCELGSFTRPNSETVELEMYNCNGQGMVSVLIGADRLISKFGEKNQSNLMGPQISILSPCSGNIDVSTNTSALPDQVYKIIVPETMKDCKFNFQVSGAGGGACRSNPGGNGGENAFEFIPGQAGTLNLVVGGGGEGRSRTNRGAAGGGASSVYFDPDADPSSADQFVLAIAGGGGGAGCDPGAGGHGGGDSAGGDAIGNSGKGFGAPGDGSGGTNGMDPAGGACVGFCTGGPGGNGSVGDDTEIGGFGLGNGYGPNSVFGGGGGGGYGGGGQARWDEAGGGGAGVVHPVPTPSSTRNLTIGGGQGQGASGGSLSSSGRDGYIRILISD